MPHQDKIILRGLTQNNLKSISLDIPKEQLVVFTGVSGSGKSSIVFDTVAAESQRQMNETYSAWIRGRLPKYELPKADLIENLSASVIVDQSRLGGNVRSTVGTISDMYATLRLLYSRIGRPYAGTASYFSFNDPNGMCLNCSGLGKVMELDLLSVIDGNKSLNGDMIDLPAFQNGKWYWKQYVGSGLFDNDKKFRDYTERERNILFYGAETKDGKRLHKSVEGIYNMMDRLLLKRDINDHTERSILKLQRLVKETVCPCCGGRRLNKRALECKVAGYSIDEMCDMEFTKLRELLLGISDPRAESLVNSLVCTLTRMIDIGLPYLSMSRQSSTLSGGEAQRLKLVRYMGSSLTGMIYIFDEPSTGMHPRDVFRMNRLLKDLRDKGNTVLVVEHDKDVISIADHVVDVGPRAGRFGGEIMYQGSYQGLLDSDTLTGRALGEYIPLKAEPRSPTGFLPVRNANVHNLKNLSVDIPLGVLTAVTGVAGSGKSSLIRDVFAVQYAERVIMADQSPITATSRSTSASFLGFFDEIRKLMARQCSADASLFSFNSKGGCPKCGGRGMITTELVFMDPVTTLCEECEGSRYSHEALSHRYRGRNIVEILDMQVTEALDFFADSPKILKPLRSMDRVGLSYLSLGQPLSTLSGGERQRLKLAKYLDMAGSIYLLDEPTTGLHASDVQSLLKLLDSLVQQGNSVIVIEHNLDFIKQVDYIIDIGPDGGSSGGELVFCGTPQEMVKKNDGITAQYLRLAVEG